MERKRLDALHPALPPGWQWFKSAPAMDGDRIAYAGRFYATAPGMRFRHGGLAHQVISDHTVSASSVDELVSRAWEAEDAFQRSRS